MPNRELLTDQFVRNIGSPADGSETYWDTSTRGFGIRVSSGGAKTFLVLIASGRRQAIGRYPVISLSQARTEARRILAEKALGKIRPTHTAFDDAKAEFLKDCEQRLRTRTVTDYIRLLKRHYPFGRKSLSAITPQELVRILNKLNSTPAEKHHAYTAGRAFFRWCRSQHLIDRNPLEDVAVRPANNPRERVLTNYELACVLNTALAGTQTFHAIVALLCLLGQRRSETAALQWSWIDQKQKLITLPPEITKNSRQHTFPYGMMTAKVLSTVTRLKDNPYLFSAAREINDKTTVFNGWSKAKAAFNKELKDKGFIVAPFTLHDLRRTLRTKWAELGVLREVAEKYINHVSGVHSGVEGTYNRHKYISEMREAVSLWEDQLFTVTKSRKETKSRLTAVYNQKHPRKLKS